jgi:hypothetical protein
LSDYRQTAHILAIRFFFWTRIPQNSVC